MEINKEKTNKILIIDDNEAVARVVKISLQKEYEVEWMENPHEALKWLECNGSPDLILSDIRMPQMRGDDFLKHIKSQHLYEHIPVIMLSGEDSTTEKIRLLNEGAADYIVKPFNPLELKLRIKRIVG
ncbi:MAG: response regulator transcription factor [Bacteroidales bacterium]